VRGRIQIVYGLLTSAEGTPIAIEVFAGNTGDPKTVSSQVQKVRERFGVTHVCLVGDRGMLTKARLNEDVIPAQLDYLTALRAPEIKALVETSAIQLSLFDETDLFEILHPDYPEERLVCCKNPLLAAERRAKRESLLKATEVELQKIAEAVAREKRPLRGADKIGLRLGRVVNRYKMAKHFETEITEDSFSFSRKEPPDRRRGGA
jgi:transposase